MLYGMGDAIQGALVDRGHRVRVYTPYGALLPGMAYLVRRLLENTSNESFLKPSSAAQARIDDLLRDPEEIGAMLTRTRRPRAERHAARPASCRRSATSRRPTSRGPRTARRCGGARARSAASSAGTTRSSSAAQEVDTGPATARLAQSRATARGSSASVDGRSRARRAGRRRRRRAALPAWARLPARDRAAVLVRAAAIFRPAASSWPPGRSTSAASPGARPTPTSPRRSTSASSTPAR